MKDNKNPFESHSWGYEIWEDARKDLIVKINQLEEENKRLKAKIDQFGKSTSDLKSKFIGEHKFEVERWDSEQETEYYENITVPWTLQKQIFKEMCEYVKNRKDEDIRP